MQLARASRQWHRWVSMAVTLPFVITLVTGLLLASRGFNAWVQPSFEPSKSELKVSFEQILAGSRTVPEAEIQSWEDVSQIDVRPATGNVRVRSRNTNWEINLDGATGAVLGHGPRRFSTLVAIHEGAYFGPLIRYGIFFPSALGVLFLLISGVIIYAQPYLRKRQQESRS